MRGEVLWELMTSELKAESNSDLARKLGVTPASLSQLRTNSNLGEKQIANFIGRVVNTKVSEQVAAAIDPIVEFFPINSNFKTKGNERVPFDIEMHPDLKIELKSKIGIYTFYNSEGRIIYLGKTTKNLYEEMVQTFNRKIERYKIFRAPHGKSSYSPSKKSQIVEESAHFFDTVRFFSCYSVAKDLVGVIEAFSIRVMPNNVINKRM
jgi:hypothetical protein